MAWSKFGMILIIFVISASGSNQNELGSIKSFREILKSDDPSLERMKIIANEILAEYEKIVSIIAKLNNRCTPAIEDVERIIYDRGIQLYLMQNYTSEWEEIQEIKKVIADKIIEIALLKLKSLQPLNVRETSYLDFILELQNLYELDIANLSLGVRLTADECVSLALASYDDGEYGRGAAWAREAFERIRMGESCSYESQANLIAGLAIDVREDVPKNSTFTSYKHLCRRRTTSSSKSHHMICQYITSSDPFLLFTPMKSETLAYKPDIILFHDMIPANEIERLKKVLFEEDYRNRFRNTHKNWFANEEISSIVWRINNATGTLPDEVYEEILLIHNTPIDYTTFTRTEPISSFDQRKSVFNAIMFLSNVESGGHIVFDRPLISVKPSKGSVLCWKNGGGVKMAECPVLVGDKWTAKVTHIPEDVFKMANNRVKNLPKIG